ncbi:RidA family protein [Sphingorhabdus sp. EL138]|uniref:RidA family protein n=1 Tax=Sphingorhabdus sp. EL138 TaxID=2073156 RepID=UPI000D68B243|nr:RidA family protein [Sphingorhabdus sp. EL138]
MKRIEPNAANQPQTHANGILSGDDLFISGQIGVDTSTGETVQGIATQAAVALANLVSVVETAGGGVGDIAKLTIYVADMVKFHAEAEEFMTAFDDVFGDDYIPAMTLVGVTVLMSPDYLVEIEGHAKIGTGTR